MTIKPQNAKKLTRAGAFLVDEILAHVVIAIVGMLAPFVGHAALSFVYSSTQDNILGAGRSLGRSMVKQRLMTVDGRDVSHATAIGRNALRWLMWLTGVLFLVDLCLFIFGDGRLMVDRIFDTQVFEDPDYSNGIKVVSDRSTSFSAGEVVSSSSEERTSAFAESDPWRARVDEDVQGVGSDWEEMSDWEERLNEDVSVKVEEQVKRGRW